MHRLGHCSIPHQLCRLARAWAKPHCCERKGATCRSWWVPTIKEHLQPWRRRAGPSTGVEVERHAFLLHVTGSNAKMPSPNWRRTLQSEKSPARHKLRQVRGGKRIYSSASSQHSKALQAHMTQSRLLKPEAFDCLGGIASGVRFSTVQNLVPRISQQCKSETRPAPGEALDASSECTCHPMLQTKTGMRPS